ncbi:hypothetical protein FMLHJGGC_00096 [Staphylococcus phage BSwM-KMM1]|nr:hypothetical protein FMLHJGGC_00096 [Pseudomonas phage BSwM KMM1]
MRHYKIAMDLVEESLKDRTVEFLTKEYNGRGLNK